MSPVRRHEQKEACVKSGAVPDGRRWRSLGALVTRRRLLALLSLLVLGVGAILVRWRRPQLWQLARIHLTPRLDESSPTGTLTRDELQTVVAFGEILVEGRALSSTERECLVEYLNDRTRGVPGYLELYRTAAALLDRTAGQPFATLDAGRRAAVMVSRRLVDYDVRTREYLLPFRRQELALRTLVVPDLIEGYYRSAAGWAIVGYAAFPGRCGDMLRYTRPEP
jgi:hypothetical protein